MSKIEEVKGIIYNALTARTQFKATSEELAHQIRRLFPPYQDVLWSEKEGQCFWCKQPTHWLDVDYEGYICSLKCQREIEADVRSKVEPVPDMTRDEADKRLLTEKEIRSIPFYKLTPKEALPYTLLEAQLVKDEVECHAKVEMLFKEIEEHIFTFDGDGNLIIQQMMGGTRVVEWWQSLKKRVGINES